MSTLPETESSLVLQELKDRPMSNEEILQLLAFYCQGETAKPYIKEIELLEKKYDMSLEIRTIEVEVLSLTELFPVRVLKNYYDATGKVGFHNLILDVIRGYQENPSASLYASRLEQATGQKPDAPFIRDMLKFIQDSELDGTGIIKLEHHYKNLLDEVSDYAPIPEYIHEFGIILEDLPRLEEQEVAEDMPASLIAQHLIGQLDDYNIQIEVGEDDDEGGEEERLEILTERIAEMTLEEREEFLHLFRVDPVEVERIQQDPDLYRVYGPLNQYPETDFSTLAIQQNDEYDDDVLFEEGQPDINKIFGGARMFIDMSLEYDEEFELPVEDWFTGKCFQCSDKIRAYHHAVREPRVRGGWRGCFCTWKCVRDFIKVDTIPDDDHLEEFELRMGLVDLIEKEMNEVGIEDRDYEPLEEELGKGYLESLNVEAVEDTRAKLRLPQLPKIGAPSYVNVEGGEINQPL